MINTTPTGTDLMTMADPQPWMRHGACVGKNPELWFPHEGQQVESREAKRICMDECPMLARCQLYAMEQPSTLYGIWGGLSQDDRRALRRKRAS